MSTPQRYESRIHRLRMALALIGGDRSGAKAAAANKALKEDDALEGMSDIGDYNASIQEAGNPISQDPNMRAGIQALKDQVLICLLVRLGGDVVIPVPEVDGTGAYNVSMEPDCQGRSFRFVVSKKS